MHSDLHVPATNHTRKVNDTHALIFGPVTVIENHRRSIMLPRDLLPDLPSRIDGPPASLLQRTIVHNLYQRWLFLAHAARDMFLPPHLAHLRFGRMTHVPGTAVQFPERARLVSLSSVLQGGPLSSPTLSRGTPVSSGDVLGSPC